MPVKKVGDKFAIGSGKAMYDSKAKAERAYKGYLGAKYGNMNKTASFNKLGQWSLNKAVSDPDQYTVNPMKNEEEVLTAIRQDIMAELDAINLYSAHMEATQDKDLKKLLLHIIKEEKEHAEELQALLDKKQKK